MQVWLKSDKNNRYFYIKTCVHVWNYLAEFFLEWEIFLTKIVELISHSLCSITFFFQKSCHMWSNVEKCGTARKASNDNIISHMCFAHLITKAIGTHSEYVVCTGFCMATVVTQTHLCVTFICTLSVLFILGFINVYISLSANRFYLFLL